jgi:hypothetical protein
MAGACVANTTASWGWRFGVTPSEGLELQDTTAVKIPPYRRKNSTLDRLAGEDMSVENLGKVGGCLWGRPDGPLLVDKCHVSTLCTAEFTWCSGT